MIKETITLYGADWCDECKESKEWLKNNSIEYEYIDIDSEEGTVIFKETGYQSIPVLEIGSTVVGGFEEMEYQNYLQ